MSKIDDMKRAWLNAPEISGTGFVTLSALRDIKYLLSQLDADREAFKEISLGRGPFSMDHMEHAKNTIEAMKEIAKQRLAKLEE